LDSSSPKRVSRVSSREAEAAQIEWPHAFARREFSAEHNLNQYHAAYGDWVEKLKWVYRMLKIEYKVA